MRRIWIFCLVLVCLFWGAQAQAGELVDRLAQFPEWNGKPPVQAVRATEDLVYPEWMAGTWNVTSTLVDMVAPLAPDIVTPGFESNRQYLNKPVRFPVRFQPVSQEKPQAKGFPFFQLKTHSSSKGRFGNQPLQTQQVVADRAFNGLNIARATLGDRFVLSVKVDPNNPNRQITSLPRGLQLVSVVTSRGSETPEPNEFIATEVCQQLFRGGTKLYLNEVETTTAFRREKTPEAGIVADQITAIYLSPQDPNYFKAASNPVSLYRYRLELSQIDY